MAFCGWAAQFWRRHRCGLTGLLLAGLVHAWNSEPDYSHGFFVAPLAILFLWARREQFPGDGRRQSWTSVAGLGLIAASVAVRAIGAHFYLDALDGWSILPWVAGVVLLLAGWKVFWWSLPSIAFLWFMVPLPFRVERWLSLPLQGAATKLSCWILQALGQPALAEGHTIILGDNQLEVEQACSGLRIFVGIVALAFVYAILMRRQLVGEGDAAVQRVADRPAGQLRADRGHGVAVSVRVGRGGEEVFARCGGLGDDRVCGRVVRAGACGICRGWSRRSRACGVGDVIRRATDSR